MKTRLKSYPRNSGKLQSHSAKRSGSPSSLKKQLSLPVFSHVSTVWIPIIANILKSSFILWSKKCWLVDLNVFLWWYLWIQNFVLMRSHTRIIKTANINLSIQQLFSHCLKEKPTSEDYNHAKISLNHYFADHRITCHFFWLILLSVRRKNRWN